MAEERLVRAAESGLRLVTDGQTDLADPRVALGKQFPCQHQAPFIPVAQRRAADQGRETLAETRTGHSRDAGERLDAPPMLRSLMKGLQGARDTRVGKSSQPT